MTAHGDATNWGVNANICRVLFIMPPVSLFDAAANSEMNRCGVPIISNAKVPSISIGKV